MAIVDDACLVGLHAMVNLSEGKLAGSVLSLYSYVSSRDTNQLAMIASQVPLPIEPLFWLCSLIDLLILRLGLAL